LNKGILNKENKGKNEEKKVEVYHAPSIISFDYLL